MYPEELHYVKMIDKLPMFWGQDAGAMEAIEAFDINDYYLLAQEKITVIPEQGKNQTFKYRPTLFRITKTIMGRAVMLAEGDECNLFGSTEPSAIYLMPQMPWEMIRKMDEFFREVYKKHGTEAVLVLTYDPAFLASENPSAGWKCIAPKQENTIGSCDYKPDSVLERKQENDIILGTIHSHPEMSAFFSGTDHKDQDDWDGVHITQAWRGTGPTEYHIEMILGGKGWNLTPEQVFGSPPLPNYDSTEVGMWLESVEKKVYQTTSTIGHGQGTYNHLTQSSSFGVPVPNNGFSPAAKIRSIRLPADAPDPRTTYIIPQYPSSIVGSKTGSFKCRMCDAPILTHSVDNRRCMACAGFILPENETLAKLLAFRKADGYPYFLGIDAEKADMPICIWLLNGAFSTDQRVQSEAVSAPKA